MISSSHIDVCLQVWRSSIIIAFLGQIIILSIAEIDGFIYRNQSGRGKVVDIMDITMINYISSVADNTCGPRAFCDSSRSLQESWTCMECIECHCDDLCFVYKDCCMDKYFEGGNGNLINRDLSDYVSCFQPYPNHKPLLAVTKCPPNANTTQDIATKCLDPLPHDLRQTTLVTDVLTNVTFRNEYCAKCHGIEKFLPWNNRASCTFKREMGEMVSKVELWRYILSQNCPITVHPPENVEIRTCEMNLTSACNASGQWSIQNNTIEQLCQQINNPVHYILTNGPIIPRRGRSSQAKQWYRNIFCLMCDGVNLNREVKVCLDFRALFNPPPLTILMDFNRDDEQTQIYQKSPCDPNSTMDPLSGTCVTVVCTDRRVLANKRCIPKFSTVQWLGYNFSITMKTSSEVKMSHWGNVTNLYEEYVRDVFSQFKPTVLIPMTLTVFVTSPSELKRHTQSRFHSLKAEGRIVSSSNRSMDEFEEAFKRMQSTPWVVNSGNFSFVMEAVFSSCGRHEIDDSTFVSIYENRTVSDYSEVLSSRCHSPCIDDILFVDIESQLSCPYIEYNLTASQFEINQTSQMLTINNTAVSVNNTLYYICGDVVKICVEAVEKLAENLQSSANMGAPNTKIRWILGIVTFVCHLVSLVALLFTFLVYTLLPKLRRLPGKNTMALIVHLFISQLLFLTISAARTNALACQVIAVLLHYFWLATFAWMVVCAFNMYRVFTDLLASRHASLSDRAMLIRYCLVANIAAFICVGGCLCYNLIPSQGKESGYGGQNCFLTHWLVLLIAFATPVAIALLCNIYFFTRTVFSIRNIPNMKNSTHNLNRRHVGIYFRLSVLLGFAWLIGFIQEIYPSIVFEFLFVILNASQGVFVFVAFCLSRRVLGLLKDRLVKSPFTKTGSSSTPRTNSTSM